MRVIAQNAITKAFIHKNLPIELTEEKLDLSGSGSLAGIISPVRRELLDTAGQPILGEWTTNLYVERDHEIVWGGVIHSGDFEGSEWRIEAAGFWSYLARYSYDGPYYGKINWNPITVVGDVWNYVQTRVDGDLDVELVLPTNCPVRVGLPAVKAAAGVQAKDAEPYVLTWWEDTNLGNEIESLSREVPFDYTERHFWDGETIRHQAIVHYPRAGRRRTDLAFVEGANISNVVQAKRSGDDFANVINVLGKGEGAKRLRATAAVRDGKLRRPVTIVDPLAGTTARLQSIARAELTKRTISPEITSITVKDHRNAPHGATKLGDDILIQANMPWLGRVSLWHRVTAIARVDGSTQTFTTARSERYRYGQQGAAA